MNSIASLVGSGGANRDDEKTVDEPSTVLPGTFITADPDSVIELPRSAPVAVPSPQRSSPRTRSLSRDRAREHAQGRERERRREAPDHGQP